MQNSDDEIFDNNSEEFHENGLSSDSSNLELENSNQESIPSNFQNDFSDLESENGDQENISSNSQNDSSNDVEESSADLSTHGGVVSLTTRLMTVKKVVLSAKFLPIVVIFAFFIFICLLVLSYGTSSISFDYIAPKCTNMSVTIGSGDDAETRSISMEQFIISHVYSATKDLENVNRNLYRTLAIAINTEVQSSGSCNKTYIPEVDDIYSFEILDMNSAFYLSIQSDIKEVKDLVMVDKKTKNYFSTSLDGFCYNYKSDNVSSSSNLNAEDDLTSDDEEEDDDHSSTTNSYYTLAQLNYEIPSSWVEQNIKNEHFWKCPCNQPDPTISKEDNLCYEEEWNFSENSDPDLIYVDGGTGTGVSIYAAHYLTSERNKSYEGVLKLFYPNNDWEFASNDSSLNQREKKKETCSGGIVPFNATPLTRSEFISLVTEFLSNGSYASYAQYFIDYAGEIYDMGKDKAINPELIYIFARKEVGFSANTSDTQHYNYYGMGHCNTCSHGTFYNSFMEGVEDLYDYFVRKGSIEAVVKVYSYLGKYLANPGSPSDGGCYFLTLPEVYGSNYSRCNPSYKCASSGGGVGCVLTSDEEHQAYIDWQAKKYVDHRQAIFKLGKEICDISPDGGLDGSTDGTTFLSNSISQFLSTQNSSLDDFNDKVIEQGCNNIGTGKGVAYVAATAVSQLASYGKKFHYVWGGMHGGQPSNYGVPSSWGVSGPDCSGFVSWALYNAGFTWISYTASDWGDSGQIVNLDDDRVQVGDFILTPGSRKWNHIVIITAIHRSEGYYSVVEAANSKTGVVFNTVPINGSSSRKVALMSDYYATATKSDAFANMCSSRR